MAEERLQRFAGGCVLRRHRQGRQRLVAQRQRIPMTAVLRTADLHPQALVEALAQAVRRQVKLVRRQQRTLDVVAALVVAVARLRPERFRRFAEAVGQYRQRVGVQVIEQRGGGIEEQRQVVLHARRRQARFQVLVQRAAARVHVEAVAQQGHRAFDRALVQRHLAARQQLHRFHPVQRALAFRVEVAERIDGVVQQFDAQRRVGAHRVDIQQPAAHGEIAGVEHLRHVPVAGGLEAALLGIEVQPLAHAVVEAAAGDVLQRREALHQRLHRHHHDALLQGGQAMQGREPLGDDVRMRTELVVGQGFPIRERHHRQVAGGAEQRVQVGFQLVRLVVVAGDHQQRAFVRARSRGDRPCQRRRRGGCAPPGAGLAAAGQRGNGEGVFQGVGHGYTTAAAPDTVGAQRMGERSLASTPRMQARPSAMTGCRFSW